jgi:hypothetical protein
MLGGHSTLNTVVLGEGMSKYQIPPHFGHHSCYAVRTGGRSSERGGGYLVGTLTYDTLTYYVVILPYSAYYVSTAICIWPPSIALWGSYLGAPLQRGGAIRRIYRYLNRLSIVKW